jgi:hypothetical protein
MSTSSAATRAAGAATGAGTSTGAASAAPGAATSTATAGAAPGAGASATGGAAAAQDADEDWRLSAHLRPSMYRQYWRVDLLELEFGLPRASIIAAAKKEEGRCFLCKRFKVDIGVADDGSVRRGFVVTHIAYNPDVGVEPHLPACPTSPSGKPVAAQDKRRRKSSAASAASEPDETRPRDATPPRGPRPDEAPPSVERDAARKKPGGRRQKKQHGAADGSAVPLIAANAARHGAARAAYAVQVAALEAQVETRVETLVEARLAAEGAEMKRDAEASATAGARATFLQSGRRARADLRDAVDALDEERVVNADMKTHEWRQTYIDGPREEAAKALRAAEQRADAAEQRADAADARRNEIALAADAAARACVVENDRALAAETQKVAESASALAACQLELRESTAMCKARADACRRSDGELADVRRQLGALVGDFDETSRRNVWLVSTKQSLTDREEGAACGAHECQLRPRGAEVRPIIGRHSDRLRELVLLLPPALRDAVGERDAVREDQRLLRRGVVIKRRCEPLQKAAGEVEVRQEDMREADDSAREELLGAARPAVACNGSGFDRNDVGRKDQLEDARRAREARAEREARKLPRRRQLVDAPPEDAHERAARRHALDECVKHGAVDHRPHGVAALELPVLGHSHDGSRGAREVRGDHRRDDRRAGPDARHDDALGARAVQLHRDGVGSEHDDRARDAVRVESLDALPQLQRPLARALARSRRHDRGRAESGQPARGPISGI